MFVPQLREITKRDKLANIGEFLPSTFPILRATYDSTDKKRTPARKV